MAPTNRVLRSKFGPAGSSRFDAEAYGAEDLEHEQALRDSGGRPLADLTTGLSVPTIGSRRLNRDVQYLSISSVDAQDGALFPDALSDADLPSRGKWIVKTGDILVSQVRPERGAVGYVTSDLDGAIASSGFYAIKSSELPPGTSAALFLFLRTNAARRQLVRRNRNSMYPAVLSQDVGAVTIPSFSADVLERSERFMDRVIASRAAMLKNRALTTGLFDELLEHVGSPPSPFDSRKGVDTTTISRSAAFGAGSAARIDAEFFRSEYSDYEMAISAAPHFRLEDYFDLFSGTWVPGDDDLPVLKQSVLTNYGPNFSAVELEKAKRSKGTKVLPGDILLASTAHEIAYVGKKVDQVRSLPIGFEDNQAVAELMIIRRKSDSSVDVSTSYVVDFLRHTAGRYQVQRCIRGLRGGHTYARDIRHHVVVPRPEPEWMKEYETQASATEAARSSGIDVTREGVNYMESIFG